MGWMDPELPRHTDRSGVEWTETLATLFVTEDGRWIVTGDAYAAPDHNCDANGCTSVSHVILRGRFSDEQVRAAKAGG